MHEHAIKQPTFICSMSSGDLVRADMQHLPGYCILKSVPSVHSINALSEAERTRFLLDMTHVGDVLMDLLHAYRINYAIFGNSDQYLHAHIVPRYLSEPEQYLHNTPWSYSQEEINQKKFDLHRDAELIQIIAKKIADLSF